MGNEMNAQPLDALMIKLNLTNADLVNASTEQLSFKMVSKARKGREQTLNIQEKIFKALLLAKPDLKIKRRDLFHYEPDENVVGQITNALSLVRSRKIKYPKFIDLLDEARIKSYIAEVAPNRITFFGTAGKAHTEQGPTISQGAPGYFNEMAIRAAIVAAQKAAIDHETFLKKIYEAGVLSYEVSIRSRNIEYKGLTLTHKEKIPPSDLPVEISIEKPDVKKAAIKSAKKKKKDKKSMTTKARMAFNENRFKRRASRRKAR